MEGAEYSGSRIAGRTALITGASSGIGAACAYKFAASGSKLILIARRLERLEAIKRDLEAKYKTVQIHVMQLDITDKKSVAALPSSLPGTFADVDILINNAGLALGMSPGYETDVDDFEVMLQTNVLAVASFLRTFVPGMLKRNRGHIINISSIAGKGGAGGTIARAGTYSATKAALDSFTHALRHELVATPLRVTLISPGMAKTEFALVRLKGDAEAAEKYYQNGELLQPDDIADAVLYAANCPPHVQVMDLQIVPTCQSALWSLHRPPA